MRDNALCTTYALITLAVAVLLLLPLVGVDLLGIFV